MTVSIVHRSYISLLDDDCFSDDSDDILLHAVLEESARCGQTLVMSVYFN